MAVLVALVDLGTKWFAENRLDTPVSLVADFELKLGHNSGIAFGAFNDLPAGVLAVGVGLIIVGLIAATTLGALQIPRTAVGLLLGGAVANLIDRLIDGRVTDFIDPPRWPAFNIADVAITCAVILILWRGIQDDRRSDQPSTTTCRSQPS